MPPLTSCLSAIGTRSPTGAKMIAASGRLGWGRIRPAGPFATHGTGELLSLAITGAREGEDAPALMPRDLGHDMGRGSKAEDCQSLGVARCLEATISDEPGT